MTFFTAPVQQTFYQTFGKRGDESEAIRELKEENDMLRKKLLDQKKLLAENHALKDQFQTIEPKSVGLLPAHVLGAPGFMPGVSLPEFLIVNKGKRDGVQRGQAVIVKDSVIGTILQVSQDVSTVSLLVSSSTISFTAKTLETQAIGLVRGGESELSLQNVLLSQKLKRGDLAVTKGDIDKSGTGFPPDLVVGRIVAVDKKPSALFQTAKLKSLVDVSKLTTVFIIQTYK